MQLSIIIPVYNEEKNIGKVIEKIKKIVEMDTKIIVVDDGSTDDTAKKANEKGAKVIKNSFNEGKGVALRKGLKIADGDLILFIDGDGQDDPSDIPRLIEAVESGADFVIGSRWLGIFERGSIKKLNFFVSYAITFLINVLFGSNITDSQAGFRCMRKEKLNNFDLKSKGYSIETEMLLKAIKNDLEIVEVPVNRLPRRYGKSNMKRFRLGLRILFFILKEFLIREGKR